MLPSLHHVWYNPHPLAVTSMITLHPWRRCAETPLLPPDSKNRCLKYNWCKIKTLLFFSFGLATREDLGVMQSALLDRFTEHMQQNKFVCSPVVLRGVPNFWEYWFSKFSRISTLKISSKLSNLFPAIVLNINYSNMAWGPHRLSPHCLFLQEKIISPQTRGLNTGHFFL